MFKRKKFLYLISYIFSYKKETEFIKDFVTTGEGRTFVEWPSKIKTKEDIFSVENDLKNNFINDCTNEINAENLININVCSFCLLQGK